MFGTPGCAGGTNGHGGVVYRAAPTNACPYDEVFVHGRESPAFVAYSHRALVYILLRRDAKVQQDAARVAELGTDATLLKERIGDLKHCDTVVR